MVSGAGTDSTWPQRLSNGLKRIAAAQGTNAVLVTSARVAHELTNAEGACALLKDRSRYLVVGVDGREVQSLPSGPSLQRLMASAATADETIVQRPPELDLQLHPGEQWQAETLLTVPLGISSTYLAIGYYWGAGHTPGAEQLAMLPGLAWATGIALQAQQKERELQLVHEQRRVQMVELQHRVRNVLSVVRSLIRRSNYAGESAEDFASHLEARISALARTQGSLSLDGHSGSDLEDLIRSEFTANAIRDNQFTISGPPLRLTPRATETLALTLHELSINALKFGALNEPGGHIDVQWTIDSSQAPARLRWRWHESGAPFPVVPQRRGFGQELIERVLPYELGATTSWSFAADGVRCEIDIPLNERTMAVGTPDRKADEEFS